MDRSVPTTGSCLDCLYDLRGLENPQCPECGRAFDPADATTIGPPELKLGLVGRWAMAAPGWATWAFTGATLLAILWYARFPASVRETHSLSLYRALWHILAIFWIGRLVIQLTSRLRHRHAALRRRINVRRTTLVLAAGLCIAMAVHDDLLCHAALRLSRPAFQRLALRYAATGGGSTTFQTPRWVGLYRIDEAYQDGRGGPTYFFSWEGTASIRLDADSLTIDATYYGDTGSVMVPFMF